MKKLLIVDDEEDMVWSLQKNLNGNSLNIDLLAAHSGEEALEIMKETPVDLLITDIRMPGISGLDLLLNVRQNYPNTGVIVMTAYPNPEFKKDAAFKGCLHFIEKPFDINYLRGIIKEALDSDKGFKGTVSGIDLTDIIQINCLSKATAALKVKTLDKEGVIFFKDGNIIHALTGDREGEEAFYNILGFEGGTIESIKGSEAPANTIKKGHEALLMEGMRLIDEASKNKGDAQKNETPSVVDSAKELLDQFALINGVTLACLMKKDGVILESIANPDIDTETVGILSSDVLNSSKSLVKHLGNGSLDTGILEYKEGSIFLSPVSEELFLTIVAREDADVVQVMTELKKIRS